MKLLTYILAVTTFVFGMNTSQAASTENSIADIAAAGGHVSVQMDRNGETLSIEMKADNEQRAVIQMRSSRGELVYNDIVIVNSTGVILDIDMTEFDKGIFTLGVKGTDLMYLGRFKNK